ncbi:MAG: hypothetical protein ACJ73D_02295 [Pyrinomonadaceae bacterium]
MKVLSGLIAVGMLVCVVVGCSKFGGSTSNTANIAPTPEGPMPKVVDILSLAGKDVDEVKAALGPATRESSTDFTWEYPQGDLYVSVTSLGKTPKEKKRVMFMTFTAKVIFFNGQMSQGYRTYDKLGDLVGFDTRGKTPTTSDVDKPTGTVDFSNVDYNGRKIYRVSFSKVSGTFISVTMQPDEKM